MTNAASSFHPPWAILCWTDGEAIFTEIPAQSGPPFIQRYSLTEGGLSKALAFLRAHHLRARSAKPEKEAKFEAKASRILKAAAKPKAGTAEQRERARALIRRLRG